MQQLFDGLLVAGQLQTCDFHLAKEQGVSVVINNRPDGEETGQLDSRLAKALCEQLGMEYHYLPMENGKPLPEGLVEEVASVINQAEDTVLMHCRTGTRSSILWAIGKVSEGKLTTDEAIACAANAGINIDKVRPRARIHRAKPGKLTNRRNDRRIAHR